MVNGAVDPQDDVSGDGSHDFTFLSRQPDYKVYPLALLAPFDAGPHLQLSEALLSRNSPELESLRWHASGTPSNTLDNTSSAAVDLATDLPSVNAAATHISFNPMSGKQTTMAKAPKKHALAIRRAMLRHEAVLP